MEVENSEAPDSARTTIPTENICGMANEEQAPIEKTNLSEVLMSDTAIQNIPMQTDIMEAPDSVKVTVSSEIVHKIGSGRQAPIEKTNPSEVLMLHTSIQDTLMQNYTIDASPSPPLTHALEALLGGLDPPGDNATRTVPEDQPVMNERPESGGPERQQAIETPADQIKIPGLFSLSNDAEFKEPTVAAKEAPQEAQHTEPILATEDIKLDQAFPIPYYAVMGDVQLEANPLGEASAPPKSQAASTDETIPISAIENNDIPGAPDEEGEEHPEWEVDSSPIESSSDDSSSDDSSSDESDEGDNAYKLLSPEEQARILMAGDGGSDDEGEKPKGSGGQLRTKNEIPDEVIPKPDVKITPDMKITELGTVETTVGNILLVKAKTSGEYKVLESGSVLCLEDRSVIGVVAETLGRVQQPLYSVLFTNADEITVAGLDIGTKVFYSEQHSTYVFTQALKAYKGSDASNLHDEEVGDEEIEFSDDEAEAEHKRRVKQKRIEKRGGKTQQNGGLGRGGHPLQQQHTPYDASNGISYDDAEDDGPYKPLSRPAGYADSVGRGEAPQEGSYSGERSNNNQNRDQFRGRGKGDRGRGRGDRGRGRGGYQSQRGGSNGYSLPPQSQRNQATSSSPGIFAPAPFQPQGRGFTPASPTIVPPPNFFNMSSPQQYSPHQPQLAAWPQFPHPPFQQQPYSQSFQSGQSWQSMPPAVPLNGGAFINPAFFNNNQNSQTGQWNGQGRGRGTGGS